MNGAAVSRDQVRADDAIILPDLDGGRLSRHGHGPNYVDAHRDPL